LRGRLVCGLVAAVAGVAVSAAGVGGARASPSPGPGSQLWVARYHGPSNTGAASSVAVSPGGRRVFVTGVSQGSTSGLDYATVAYNAATGARLWVTRYNGPANGYDTASSVAVSPGGGMLFVTGVSQGSTSGLDYATVAYNAATGARLWVTRYNGPGNGEDGAKSVAVSPGGGMLFVTGYSQGTTSGLDYATVAYNAATGARLWVTRYNGPGNGRDFAHALAVSPGGGTVFVTGQGKAAAPGDDYATVAYNAATGAQRWAALYHGPATGQDAAFSVAVSPGGGAVYVTGASKATASVLDYEYATVAYNAATGAQRWAARTPGPVPAYDAASSVAVSPGGGAVYVTGQSHGRVGLDYATAAYNAATGAQLWVTRYNGPGGRSDAATSVAASPGGGTVYVTGQSQGTTTNLDYATVAYNAATGARLWLTRYNGPANTYDAASSLAVCPTTGTVYVTGTEGDAYATVAYHP